MNNSINNEVVELIQRRLDEKDEFWRSNEITEEVHEYINSLNEFFLSKQHTKQDVLNYQKIIEKVYIDSFNDITNLKEDVGLVLSLTSSIFQCRPDDYIFDRIDAKILIENGVARASEKISELLPTIHIYLEIQDRNSVFDRTFQEIIRLYCNRHYSDCITRSCSLIELAFKQKLPYEKLPEYLKRQKDVGLKDRIELAYNKKIITEDLRDKADRIRRRANKIKHDCENLPLDYEERDKSGNLIKGCIIYDTIDIILNLNNGIQMTEEEQLIQIGLLPKFYPSN